MTCVQPDETCGAAWDEPGPRANLVETVSAKIGRRVHDLEIEIEERGLVLRGYADCYHMKQLAQHTAMLESGLPLSANHIVVQDRRQTTCKRFEHAD